MYQQDKGLLHVTIKHALESLELGTFKKRTQIFHFPRSRFTSLQLIRWIVQW